MIGSTSFKSMSPWTRPTRAFTTAVGGLFTLADPCGAVPCGQADKPSAESINPLECTERNKDI